MTRKFRHAEFRYAGRPEPPKGHVECIVCDVTLAEDEARFDSRGNPYCEKHADAAADCAEARHEGER